MNINIDYPDRGVAAGQPRRNTCEAEPCNSCGARRGTCDCSGHDPLKAVWPGEWPDPPDRTETGGPAATDGCGFVIYGDQELAALTRQEPSHTPVAPGRRSYPDWMLEANARAVCEECLVEPVYRGGAPTGEYRAYRRGRNGKVEIARFGTQEEAFHWGKRRDDQ